MILQTHVFSCDPLATRIALRLHRMPTVLGRLSAVLLLSVLCACGKVVDLQSGLKDADVNEMVTVLNRHGIDAQKRTAKDGVALSVKDTDIARATEALNAAGLPRPNLSNLGQVFKKEGMISTPLEERVRYIHGLSSELEYTLQQFDHVVSARVHVVLPERIAPGEPIQPSSAAVFVKYIPPLDEDMVVPRVRSLVASSIPGLSGEEGRSKVSVVLAASEITAPAVEWSMVGPFQVMADSAGSLVATFTAIVVVFTLALLAMLFVILMLHPRTANWMRARFGRVLPFKMDDQATAEKTPEDPTPATLQPSA